MIATSDQSCWLAEACKILLLLLSSGRPKAFGQHRAPKRGGCYLDQDQTRQYAAA